MKKISTLAAAVTLGVCAVQAQEVYLGYTEGLEAVHGYSLAQTDVEVSAAVYLPAELLAKYPGCELSGARAMLHSRLNIDRLKTWVRTDLAGANMLEATLTRDGNPALTKGWNQTAFTSSYVIPDNPTQGVYVGVTYHQAGSTMGVAYSDKGTANAGYLLTPGADWTDVSADHTFFIEAVLTGDALPTVNLKLEEADFAPYYVIDKGVYTGSGLVRNIGTDTVTGFDISLHMQDVAKPFTQHYDCDVKYGDTFSFTYSFPMDINPADGKREVTLTVTRVNGKTDTDMTDNSREGNYRIVPYDMTRHVLLEEFTTEKCGNCPRVAGWVHELLEQPRYNDLVVPVCLHSGYGTDRFTIPSDVEYEWFYSPTYIYAPSVMIDRMRSSDGVPTFNPSSKEALAATVDAAAAIPANVSVSLHAEYDDAKVYATVRGSKTVYELCENPRLVCVITEDELPDPLQSGYDGLFVQQHVSRAVNETFGVPVPFAGEEYEYTVDLPIGNVENKQNMNLVAYIFNYDDTDRNNCAVMNASLLPFTEMKLSSIAVATPDAEADPEWYTITGMHLSSRPTAPGIYVQRHGHQSHKIIIH